MQVKVTHIFLINHTRKALCFVAPFLMPAVILLATGLVDTSHSLARPTTSPTTAPAPSAVQRFTPWHFHLLFGPGIHRRSLIPLDKCAIFKGTSSQSRKAALLIRATGPWATTGYSHIFSRAPGKEIVSWSVQPQGKYCFFITIRPQNKNKTLTFVTYSKSKAPVISISSEDLSNPNSDAVILFKRSVDIGIVGLGKRHKTKHSPVIWLSRGVTEYGYAIYEHNRPVRK